MRLLFAVLAAVTHWLTGLGHADLRVPDQAASRSEPRPPLDPYPSDADFDALAGCESTNHWADDTGNGYYGGLQISAATWDAYGGNRYAAVPSEATRTEQITIARRIQHAAGWGQWPYCSLKEGLR